MPAVSSSPRIHWLIGSHVAFAKPGYLVSAAAESVNNGADAMMIYLGAPQSTFRVDLASYQLAEYKKRWASLIAPHNIVVHAPYIINLASPEKCAFAVKLLTEDCARMNYVGSKYMVVHPGAATTFSRETALSCLVTSLETILHQTKDVIILLETMAGKGTEIGGSLDELATVMKRVNSDRLGICLDTCHIWDAGYDIVNDWSGFLKKLQQLDLLNAVKVIHVNDSRNACGARKDRHANIGQGLIGLQTLKTVVHHPFFAHTIKILETPYIDGQSPYKAEIALLTTP